MKQNIKQLTMAIIAIILLITAGCKKDKVDNLDTLKSLYNIYKNGEIDECKYNGQTVYCAGLNAYDAGSVVYDKDGNKIANCDYAWGNVDAICQQLQDCSVVYRCNNHITGEPFVDKYDLSK